MKSTDELRALAALAEAATPGPWGYWVTEDAYAEPPIFETGVQGPLRFYEDGSGGCTNDMVCETTRASHPASTPEKNAAFIAAASPDVVRELVAELLELRTPSLPASGPIAAGEMVYAVGAREMERLRKAEAIMRDLAACDEPIVEGYSTCALCDAFRGKAAYKPTEPHRELCPWRRAVEYKP